MSESSTALRTPGTSHRESRRLTETPESGVARQFRFPENYDEKKGMALVNRLVWSMSGRIPEYLGRDEVMSQGMLGLIAAARSYDISKGASFETYATIRIRGAILDWLRQMDRLPRHRRTQWRKLQETVGRLETRFQRTPTDCEIAEDLGMTLAEMRKMRRLAEPCKVISLDGVEEEEQGLRLHERIVDLNQAQAHEILEAEELKELLAERIRKLPEREQKILALYYHKQVSFAEIAKAIGFCESRVCQLHARAIAKLQTFMRSVMSGESMMA